MSEDGEHWLWRLDADAWMRAARTELDAGAEHLAQRRTAVTHARRAAGMALNAVLVAWGRAQGEAAAEAAEHRWGRSYVDHLRRVGEAADIEPLGPQGPAVAAAARALLAIGVAPQAGLVQLHASPHAPAQQALYHARALVHACAAAIAALPSA